MSDPFEIQALSVETVEVISRQKTATGYWVASAASFSAGVGWLFGLFSLLIGLSLLATIPVAQLLSLGYLMECSGRVVRTGRIRDGFVGVRKAAQVGSIVLGSWIVLWPARAVSSLWYSSYLLNGPSFESRLWRIGLIVITSLTVLHLVWAWFRGGRFFHFLWPAPIQLLCRLRKGGIYSAARDATWDFVTSLRLPHYFLLGVNGFVATALWLLIPVTLLVLASRVPVPIGSLLGLIGALLFAAVVMYLPFLQARFAATNDFSAMFDWRTIRLRYQHAPIAFLISLALTLTFALPLYLLKAELVPREAAWLPSLIFVLFMFPARLATGWALGRSEKCDFRRHFVFRWAAWITMVPVVAFYVLIVYFTQYVSWYGGLSLYEQHAFLLPVPFLGL
ncbi:MAG: hypothetical protein GY768_25745 [Planctomycetaceae bacterium]|nr:hypothetical protein [Planctomycetaceae bacterium]